MYITWKADVGNEGKYDQHVTFVNISRVITLLFSNCMIQNIFITVLYAFLYHNNEHS